MCQNVQDWQLRTLPRVNDNFLNQRPCIQPLEQIWYFLREGSVDAAEWGYIEFSLNDIN